MRIGKRLIAQVVFVIGVVVAPAATSAPVDTGLRFPPEPTAGVPRSRSEVVPAPKAETPVIDSSPGTSGLAARLNFAANVVAGARADDFAWPFDEIDSANAVPKRNASLISSTVGAGVADVLGTWKPDDPRLEGIELLAGLRYFDARLDWTLAPANPARPPSETRMTRTLDDIVVGARYTIELSDRWAVTFRGDGGFGETDSNYNASVTLKYHVGRSTWLIGYQYMDTRFESVGGSVELETFGPVIGCTLGF